MQGKPAKGPLESSAVETSQVLGPKDEAQTAERTITVEVPPRPTSMRRTLFPTGTTLAAGRLSIVSWLGEGGAGVVYEAFDLERQARVAIKTLTHVDAKGVYRLKTEFRALADLRHPNLVTLHELFAEGDSWFFSMELVSGVPFDEWIRSADAPEDDSAHYQRLRATLRQLVDGVGAVHAAGKLHRDLKPTNVLVTPEGRVVVLDFGLAAEGELGAIGRTVAEEAVSGTPAYCAPEQAAGEQATRASDCYAVGVMLFEALTGSLPFAGNARRMLRDKQRLDAPAPSAFVQGMPADLEGLCLELLSRDAGSRPEASVILERLSFSEPSSPRMGVRLAATASATELLGREIEVQALRNAYRATLSGTPTVVCVSGESGMGKSALLENFLSELRTEAHAVVLVGRCYERENVPFKAFDALVDGLSRYLRQVSRDEATALLADEVFALARLFPVLDRVPAVAEAPKKEVPDPHDLQRRAFEALCELLARIREKRPLVLFVDDLQWTDDDSVRLMRHLLLQPTPLSLLLVIAHRTEGAAENPLLQSIMEAVRDNRELSSVTVKLQPLPPVVLRAIVERLLPGNTDGAAAQLAREAGGSPFFAAVLARAARLRDEGSPPPTLDEALSMHVGSLSTSARRLLSVLALAGQPIHPAAAIEAAGVSDGHNELDALRNEQLVRASVGGESSRWVECYHDKIRESVAAHLGAGPLVELSAALARALLALPTPDPELLTRCFLSAGQLDEAADHAAQAADRAMHALAFDRAARLYEQALEHGKFDRGRMHKLRSRRADALAYAGAGVAAAEAYLSARADADSDARVELTRKAGDQYLICGQLKRGRELLGEALKPLDLEMPQTVAGAFGSMLWSRGRLRIRGLGFVRKTRRSTRTVQQLEALRNLTHSLMRSDQLRAADTSARWVLLALESGDALELARALSWEGEIAGLMGSSEAYVERIERLNEVLCDETGDPLAREWLHHARGVYRSVGLGHLEAAVEDFDKSLELSSARPSTAASYDRPWVEWQRALCLLWLGRLEELNRLVPTAVEGAWARNDLTLIPAWATLACFAYTALDAHEQAMREVQRARRIWQPDEVTVQDLQLLIGSLLVGAYRREPRVTWTASAPQRERVRSSLFARVVFRGGTDAWCCGVAAAGSMEASGAERRALLREAERCAKRTGRFSPTGSPPTAPALACARGDRDTAARELRSALRAPKIPPLSAHAARRQLGLLLGGEEGRPMVAQADRFFRAAGVVDPERYAAALIPGVA